MQRASRPEDRCGIRPMKRRRPPGRWQCWARWFLAAVAGGLAASAAFAVSWDWVTLNGPLPRAHLLSVVRGGSAWVAVGEGGTILSSPDGLHWTSRLVAFCSPIADFSSVAHGRGTFVAVGARLVETEDPEFPVRVEGMVFTSPDGADWTERFLEAGESECQLESVVWTGDRFLISGRGGEGWVFESVDGVFWKREVLGGGLAFTSLASSGKGLVAVGQVGFSDAYGLYFSATGRSWERRLELGNDSEIPPVVAGSATGFVASVRSNATQYALLHSPDGRTWTAETVPAGFPGGPAVVGWDGARFFAVPGSRISRNDGRDGSPPAKVAVRRDTGEWETLSTAVGIAVQGFTASGGRVVAVGNFGGIAVSDATLQVWTKPASGVLDDFVGLASNGRLLAAITEYRELDAGGAAVDVHDLAISTDGVSWTLAPVPVPTPRLLKAHGDQFLVFGEGESAVSGDGRVWRRGLLPDGMLPLGVAGSPTNVVVVGSIGKGPDEAAVVVSSTNAIQWIQRPLSAPGYLADVAWNGTQWLAVGRRSRNVLTGVGQVWSSLNGIQWNPGTLPEGFGPSSVVWNGLRWVMAGLDLAGDSSAVVVSEDGIRWRRVSVPVSASPSPPVIWTGREILAGSGLSERGLTSSVDGERWEPVPSRLGSLVRAMTVHRGEVLLGCYDGSVVSLASVPDPAGPPRILFWARAPGGNGRLRLVWSGTKGREYVLEARSGLFAPWQRQPEVLEATGCPQAVGVEVGAGGSRFYRLVQR